MANSRAGRPRLRLPYDLTMRISIMPSAWRLSRWRRTAAGVRPSRADKPAAVTGPFSRISRAIRALVPRSEPGWACVIWAGAALRASPVPGAREGASGGPMYFTTSLCRKYFRLRNRPPDCARRPRVVPSSCVSRTCPTMVYSHESHEASRIGRSPRYRHNTCREDLVRGHELAGGQVTGPPETVPHARQDDQPARWPTSQLVGQAVGWLSIFAVSLGLFAARFLIPVPVVMANDGDGARLMCGLGVQPVAGGRPPLDKYAFFRFHPAASCAGEHLYPSSQHILLLGAQWLTPVLGLPGRINLIALGLLTSAVASFGIESLVMGLRLNLWARLALAAALWLIMADAAFFDAFASPLSEGATPTGLLLIRSEEHT